MSNAETAFELIREAANSIDSPVHRELDFELVGQKIRVDVVFSRRLQPVLEWPTEEYLRLTRSIQMAAVSLLKETHEVTMQDSAYVRGTVPLPMRGLTRLVCAFNIRLEPKPEIV